MLFRQICLNLAAIRNVISGVVAGQTNSWHANALGFDAAGTTSYFRSKRYFFITWTEF